MDINAFINDWIAASNAFATKKHVNFYSKDALLDDVSLGEEFRDHKGITKVVGFRDVFLFPNTAPGGYICRL